MPASVDGAIPGARLKFAKGEWTLDEIFVGPKEEFRAELSSITMCWERWSDKHIVERVIATLGEKLPPREALGYLDESEVGSKHRRRTSARSVVGKSLHPIDSPKQRRTRRVCNEFFRRQKGYRLSCASRCEETRGGANRNARRQLYQHRTFGKVLTPCFAINGWVPDEGAAGAADTKLIEGPATIGHKNEALFSGVDPDDVCPF